MSRRQATPSLPALSLKKTALAASLALLGGVSSVACTGSIEGGTPGMTGSNSQPPGGGGKPAGGSSSGGNGAGMDPMGAPLPDPGKNPAEPQRDNPVCKDINPGPAPLRRLTRLEYDNTLRDLLGEDKKLAQDFPLEELQHSFDNSASLRSVSDVLAEKYTAAAEEVGKTVVGKMGTFLSCDAAKEGDDPCLNKFFDGFAKRLWRRPLDSAEKQDLQQVFKAGRTASFADGIDAVVQVMVLSPQFMYRVEKGVQVPGAPYQRLTHFEMASRLSYLLWGTMPDSGLFDAADAGKLGTREEVAAQAKRLLEDPRAAAMVTNFTSQWLQLRDLATADKDTDVYPKWVDENLDLFRSETENFISMVWKGDAKLDTLLGAQYSALNGPLAAFYGVKGVTGDAFQKVETDPTQRAGVLTHASLLAAKADPNQSSPILRGVFMREQVLCQELASVPAGVVVMPPEPNATQTTKERFAQHRSDPMCQGCHTLIDPIGFGFEKYDGTGAFRTMENGKMVDASGELTATDVDGKFDGAIELSKKLMQSKDVEACMAKQWFHFGFGREQTDGDKCTTSTLSVAFEKSGGDMRQLLLALVQTDAFFFKGGLQ